MRVLGSLFLILALLALPVGAQAQSQPSVTKDPQAVRIITQALAVAGGNSAISAITDYTATGTIAEASATTQGSATIKGLGLNEFRIDVTLPHGPRAWAVHDGQSVTKAQDGTISKMPPDTPTLPRGVVFAQPYRTPLFASSLVFPYGQVSAALTDSSLNISYQGLTQVDGHSAHDIRLQRIAPGQTAKTDLYHTKEFYFDTSSLQLLMTQDVITPGLIRQIHYVDYMPVNGITVPFLINQSVNGQASWTIQISQISFNSGLQTSDFEIQ